MLKMAENAGR